MALRKHCDICNEEITAEGHLWANNLDTKDPMRNVSAKVQFFDSSNDAFRDPTDKELDVCPKCIKHWVAGME